MFDKPPRHTRGLREPFGRIMPSPSVDTDISELKNLFTLARPVGGAVSTNRRDIAKVETLMDQTGYLDLAQTDGPTGYYGERLKQAVEGFQKDNALRRDGRINPRGETIRALRSSFKANHPAQEAAFDNYMEALESQLKSKGANQYNRAND